MAFTSAHFIGSNPNFAVPSPHSMPVGTKSRPVRVSTACASTAERTRYQFASSASSLYEVLGIHRGASCHEIKAAYRRLARVLHPDVAATSQKDGTAEEFMRVHEAYSTLSDPEKRSDYDRMLFLPRAPMGSSFAMSMSASVTAMGSSSASGFSGSTRRTWETDQCW